MAATASIARGGRSSLERPLRARLPDRALRWALTALAAGILALVAFFFARLVAEAEPALSRFGLIGFAFDDDWDVSRDTFGALPLVVGTLITSAIALVIGVPVAVATAVHLTELCPRRARGPLTVLVELLAAIPSVVYGLWGVFVLIPLLGGPSYLVAGLLLAIMILPIVSAISREVLATVPDADKEAALALGATRWEMIRIAVLPYSRTGIAGASMLGLGRAIGETIAVTLVIGNAPRIGDSVLSQGYTLAAVIANEFGEAANDPVHRAALIGAGLVLFVLTLAVNVLARAFVRRAR